MSFVLQRLHVGLNNASTGLRLTAWPTAGIILTTTESYFFFKYSPGPEIVFT